MSGSKKAFEDFTPGDKVAFRTITVSADDIVDFAADWDPQPMHLDDEAGRASILGGLTGSGWHMICLLMRGMCDGFLLESTSAGSPGVDEIRWLKPMRPGDELTMHYEVLGTRTSKSRPTIGIVHFLFSITNQHGETIMTMENPTMFGRRQTAEQVS